MTAVPGMFCAAMVTMYSGTATPIIACQLQCGTVNSTCGAMADQSRRRCVTAMSTPAPTAATANATGTAHRAAYRCSTSQVTITGATTAGLTGSDFTGARHIGSSTPASMACAISVGIAAISAPRRCQNPVSTMSIPATANAPTAAGQPPATAPVLASSAAPGVDQASVIGIR